jgi:NADH:ubiquinone oxidoreductase subunit 6 (subunit J)
MMSLFAQGGHWSLDEFLRQHWQVLVPALLALGAVYMLLPRGKGTPWLGGFVGGVALALAGVWWVNRTGPLPEIVLFYSFAGLGILGGGLMISRTNPVHAALSFALVILSSCGLFLLLAAPFLMAATIIIYAGAIVVTFLFVIMLAQQSGIGSADALSREPFLASLTGILLLTTLVTVYERSFDRSHAEGMQADLRALRQLMAAPGLGSVDVAATQELLARIEARLAKSKAAHEWTGRLRAELSEPEHANVENVREYATQLAVLVRLHPLLVADKGESALDRPLPAANVRAMGRTLFTEYLVAVEIGAVLLLVATIGAIVIAGRHSGGEIK